MNNTINFSNLISVNSTYNPLEVNTLSFNDLACNVIHSDIITMVISMLLFMLIIIFTYLYFNKEEYIIGTLRPFDLIIIVMSINFFILLSLLLYKFVLGVI